MSADPSYFADRIDAIENLLKEIVDEVREKNGKPQKYKVDKTEFTLGA